MLADMKCDLNIKERTRNKAALTIGDRHTPVGGQSRVGA